MDEKKIERINKLYRKSKKEGLSKAEKNEQELLRREYIDSVKENLRAQLRSVSVREKDGSVRKLTKKPRPARICGLKERN